MRATPTRGLIAVAMMTLTSCTELPTSGPEPFGPVASVPALGMLRGTIDLDRATLEFTPVVPPAAPGFSPAIYGDQNVNVRLYNSRVVLDSSTSTWRWTASVGIRNMRSHFIGDEETAATPLDTIGIYVFFVQDAVPGQPCPGCFARIANHDGTMGFDAPNQKFFYWHDRLNPMGSALGDTTLVRREWQFETSAGVRSFTFTVLIAAPWPPPQETRWRIQYTADVLPGAATPPWKTESWAPGGSASASGGSLALTGNAGGLLMFYRRDPIAPTQSAYIDARAQVVSGGSSRPQIALLLSDHVKLIALGVSTNTIGMMTNGGLFQTGTTSALSSGTHQLQLRKYAADSVVWFVDGSRRGRATYASLSNDTFTSSPGAYAAFGALPTTTGNSSTWDDVIYEIGVALP
jgi:hypothetical protein